MAQYFISYSRKNQAIVERLRQDLQNAGIDIWIDNVGLQPGTPDWDEALRDAIKASEAVILVASPDSRRSAYVRDEIALAKGANKPIYPVWVDGDDWMDTVPMGLGSTQNVDLRDDNYATNLTSLIGALNGKVTEDEPAIEPVIHISEIEPVENPRNPYKGLRAFHEEDSNDFFGRSVLIDDLLNAIEDEKQSARLLAVLGASGSGKSSVMMAGVLPKLRENHPDWVFLDPIVPSANPLEKLTIALARQLPQKTHSGIREDLLDRSTRGLHRLSCELSDKPIVLYIDQFEEVFTLIEKEPERRQFIDLITTAVNEADGVLIVLLSMRADFYDRPLQYQSFGAMVENQHVAIKPMTLADLYDVVQLPAQLPDVGMSFDEGLVTEMVFAVREEAAALPLLQFTLDQLFQRREGNTLTNSAYQAIGGVQGALAQHAEATFNNLPSDQHKTLARALFLRLIEAGQTEQDTTRRRATYSELTLPDVEQTRILQATADAFVNARLLVTDQSGDNRTIEVSHEALIREWQRLGDWLRNAREDLRLQKSLSADVTEWLRRNKPDDMLYRGTVLAEAQTWSERNSASRDEVAFLAESQRVEIERIVHETTVDRRSRRARLLFIGGSLIALLIVALIIALIYTTAISTAVRDNAETMVAFAERDLTFAALNVSTLQTGADIAVAQAATSEFRAGYMQFQGDWYATKIPALGGMPLPPEALNQTDIPDLYGTATALAEFSWDVQIEVLEGVEMVKVPAGCFWMGSLAAASNERASGRLAEICFDTPFWIDRYEVTNQQFTRFNGQAGNDAYWSDPDYPRTMVNWFEAKQFCESRNARLPTEAEWEYAARGMLSTVYPWGNSFVSDMVVFNANSSGDPDEVGSRPSGVSWVGAMDMSGNVFEWVNSANEPYPYATNDGRENISGDDRILRGGSFRYSESAMRSSYRHVLNPSMSELDSGFRCLRPVE